MTQTSPSFTTLRTGFFEYLFGTNEGVLCIATADAGKDKNKTFKQNFFRWPEQKKECESFIEQVSFRKNVWFCTSLLDRSERKKDYCLPGEIVWADLDTCNPDNLDPKPSVVLQSSPGRWQAIWRTDQIMEPVLASELSKRIAYQYAGLGADKSGWDLTQLLRVPYTFNYKYENADEDVPRVDMVSVAETRIPFVLLSSLPQAENTPKEYVEAGDAPWVDMPDPLTLPEPDKVIYRYSVALHSTPFSVLYDTSPDKGDDWSATMWRLLHICVEVGMSNEEVFAVAISAKCNKYARDNRPPDGLWKEVLKVEVAHNKLAILSGQRQQLPMPELITDKEFDSLKSTYIDDYKAWACEATDAVAQYHELSSFIMLSATLASGISLKTSYGNVQPNLWGLILGDSTLARKTTAMRMAMDFVSDVDQEIILATDGSAEGLLSGLAGRPNRTSIFYKDEVSGFIDSINRKDYLAGMPEILTQLYDVPRVLSRRLRKETITIQSPAFIFFGGGIRDKVYQLVTEEYVLSGFLPRFLVVSGDADLAKIRRTGPANAVGTADRDRLIHRISQLHSIYNTESVLKIGGQEISTTVMKKNEAVLTDKAWSRYGDMEEKMVHAAYESSIPMLALPTFERLSRSLLKMSLLLGASRQEPKDGKITVDVQDILSAAKYVQDWGRYSIDLIQNSGKGLSERLLEKLTATIRRVPDISRGELMQRHHLSKREADDMLNTLIERGNVIANKSGRGVRLRAV